MDTPSLFTPDGQMIDHVPTAVLKAYGMASQVRTLLQHAKTFPAYQVRKEDTAAFLHKMAPLTDDQWRIAQIGLAREGRVALLGATMEARPHGHHGTLLSILAESVPMDRAPEQHVLAAWALAQTFSLEAAYWGGRRDLSGVPIAIWRWMADLAEHHPSRFLRCLGAPYVSMDRVCGAPRGGPPQDRAALTLRMIAGLRRCAAPIDHLTERPDPSWKAMFDAYRDASEPPEPAPVATQPTAATNPLQSIAAAVGARSTHHPWDNSLHVVLSLLAGWPVAPTLALGHAENLLPIGLPGSVLDDPSAHKSLALASRLARLDPGSVRLAAQEALAALDSLPKIWVDMSECGRMIQRTRALRALFA